MAVCGSERDRVGQVSSGDLGPRSRDRGCGCLDEGSGVFFLYLFFPCPVRDEAMGTSPEEGV